MILMMKEQQGGASNGIISTIGFGIVIYCKDGGGSGNNTTGTDN